MDRGIVRPFCNAAGEGPCVALHTAREMVECGEPVPGGIHKVLLSAALAADSLLLRTAGCGNLPYALAALFSILIRLQLPRGALRLFGRQLRCCNQQQARFRHGRAHIGWGGGCPWRRRGWCRIRDEWRGRRRCWVPRAIGRRDGRCGSTMTALPKPSPGPQ